MTGKVYKYWIKGNYNDIGESPGDLIIKVNLK